jgi:hypothetical protein
VTTFQRSIVVWLAGAVIGAALSPPRKRIWGGLAGMLLVGTLGDKLIERSDANQNAIANAITN